MYYVYILRNKTGTLYKGITNGLRRRIKEHNDNKNIGTRGKGPWRLVYYEKYDTLREARNREVYFKSGIGREYLKNLLEIFGV